jgi:hypothetical protein
MDSNNISNEQITANEISILCEITKTYAEYSLTTMSLNIAVDKKSPDEGELYQTQLTIIDRIRKLISDTCQMNTASKKFKEMMYYNTMISAYMS